MTSERKKENQEIIWSVVLTFVLIELFSLLAWALRWAEKN